MYAVISFVIFFLSAFGINFNIMETAVPVYEEYITFIYAHV